MTKQTLGFCCTIYKGIKKFKNDSQIGPIILKFFENPHQMGLLLKN